MNDLTIYFWIHICNSYLNRHIFYQWLIYVPRVKDTESLLLAYNLLTTELQKMLYLHLFYCKDWSQLYYLADMNLFIPAWFLKSFQQFWNFEPKLPTIVAIKFKLFKMIFLNPNLIFFKLIALQIWNNGYFQVIKLQNNICQNKNGNGIAYFVRLTIHATFIETL